MGNSGALPIILAGPILRRVEPTRVCVWIATSRAVSVTGLVYDVTATQQLGQGKNNTVAFGEALHMTVVEITPTSKGTSPTFPVHLLLVYDLVLEVVSKDGKILARQLLSNLTSIGGANTLAYEPYVYPTFFMDDTSLNILHGSCRKAHGAGDDALACADTILQRTVSDLKNRPSALFLTGDQIYADDVHDEFISPVSTFGRYLLGFDEHIPTLPVPVHKLESRSRRVLASTFFSPDAEAKNQLLGFGDFAGLYLFSLNDELWKDQFTPKSDDLKRFLRALPKVRRALANVATYMIFDDHELTDDWNLSKTWENRALHGPQGRMGKRVIAHALCAYWAFQGWGNKPEAFDATFRKTITDYFASRESDGSAFEALMLETHPWSFVAPTTPPAFFLDSRTRRAFSTVRPDAPSALLNDDALRDFHTQVSTQQASSDWLIVIAQTPVFGNPDSERAIEDVGFKNEAKAEENDLEMWHANRAGYYKLLRVLHAIAQRGCIILSGDVHYGFVARVSVTINGTTVPFTQFTSSALKNVVTGWHGFLLSAARTKANSIHEQGWMISPKYTKTGVSKRIREILAVSPTVVTDEEFLEAGIVGKGDTTISNQPIRPTMPSDGYFLHKQTNIGQLVLAPQGEAILRFYGTQSTDPFATYKIQVDSLR